MTTEEHRLHHVELHNKLDELIADWFAHQPPGVLMSNTPIIDLMFWSHQQTLTPTEPKP